MNTNTGTEYRYWKREEAAGIIYFATATAASHARAEKDEKATEISEEEYKANVPKEVHNGADRMQQNTEQPDPKDTAWTKLVEWHATCALPFPDQIAMLEILSTSMKMEVVKQMQAAIKQRGMASH